MTRRRKILLALSFMLWFQFILSIGITKIDGTSMDNTLEDGAFYPYLNINYTKVERFDIVIIDSEVLDELIIKRVIGLPGENVKMENGEIYIDGRKIEQNFDYVFESDNFNYTLAEEEYFVLGDNRPVSLDSRIIGPIPKDQIKGALV